MVLLRYNFTLRRALNERSLMALVAGMTIMSLVRVHTSPSKHFWDGDKLLMQANTSCIVGLSTLFSAKRVEYNVSCVFKANGSKSLP